MKVKLKGDGSDVKAVVFGRWCARVLGLHYATTSPLPRPFPREGADERKASAFQSNDACVEGTVSALMRNTDNSLSDFSFISWSSMIGTSTSLGLYTHAQVSQTLARTPPPPETAGLLTDE